MPASDILNPVGAPAAWDATIQDSMCPDYGFQRKRPATQLRKKAVGGTPWTRETQNIGHSFSFSWLNRSWECVQRIKQYFEQYEDGFFTVVDWDGGGRHYVGRFTGPEFPVIEAANGMWSVQNLAFDEIPRVPMLEYPSDWDHDSILFLPWNDFGDQKLATSSTNTGAWAQTNLTGAAPEITLAGIARATLPTTSMENSAPTAGDWATYEYRGYGFELWLAKGPGYGQCDIYLDNALVQTVDCYAAAELGPQMVLQQQSVVLDIHDVQVTALATKNASASGTAIAWYALQVMR